ncbi:unnamed protein product [Cercopithifilaria johnstoni]|uniref:Uncharacterized protein n=1 Tax=Cercopithifilaria johnstoni TaxID=2874296 RepID=A0A8J2Q4J9_9BILA|nr:unnamed protein product [Cercopithifilaria johnstoni]
MRSGVNHRRSGRQSGKNWHDGMAKHVNAVMKRAKERRTTLTNTSRRVPQRLTQPISPHKRLKERAGLWMFAKQSEIIAEPNMITSSMRRRVQEDVRAVMAEDSRDRRRMWNRACRRAESNNNRSAVFPITSSVDNIFGIPSHFSFGTRTNLKSPAHEATVLSRKDSMLSAYELPTTTKSGSRNKKKDDKDLCLFPADPLLLDYAERILSALPQLNLRNNDSTSYSVAATGIVACSLRRHGIYPKGTKFQEKEQSESSRRENNTHEKFWRSFFKNLSPLNSFSAGSALLKSNSSSVKLFEFEDIPANSEHVLSNSDGANTISDVYQLPSSLSNNMSDCNFEDLFPKIEKNNAESLANLSVNSNDLMKLAMDEDFSTNISCNSLPRQPEFDLSEYRPITVSAWFERDSANMLDTSKAIYRNTKKDKIWQCCRPLECSSVKPIINEAENKCQWMKNPSLRKKIRSEIPDFTYSAFDPICHSQISHFSFDF